MTIYDVMRDGDILLSVHEHYEHIASWNRANKIQLWIETHGDFELLETREFGEAIPTLEAAIAAATKMILNVDEQARITLHDVQSLTLPRRKR